ncbi:type II toxin-antitoxin system RelE/ParE family toxin [Achromobacter piechaudii]|uniref:type II toxin-antitoxin system RelE/ParE family toxin n=1 Tax=Achromobacter piechaudii TaxID=72556 RepID=UPI001E6406AE|nr:type II toxin-antitoxin system RelE/ParE family toxin [Achromobacter piechaudii]
MVEALKDPLGRAHIMRRLDRAIAGHFGDAKPLREGVSEMRIDEGPGYRIYYARHGQVVYVLLHGGTKKKQTRDIDYAIALWNEIKRGS